MTCYHVDLFTCVSTDLWHWWRSGGLQALTLGESRVELFGMGICSGLCTPLSAPADAPNAEAGTAGSAQGMLGPDRVRQDRVPPRTGVRKCPTRAPSGWARAGRSGGHAAEAPAGSSSWEGDLPPTRPLGLVAPAGRRSRQRGSGRPGHASARGLLDFRAAGVRRRGSVPVTLCEGRPAPPAHLQDS